jgi:hypothetical protein
MVTAIRPTRIKPEQVRRALLAGPTSRSAKAMIHRIELEQAKAAIVEQQSGTVGVLDEALDLIMRNDEVRAFETWLELDGKSLELPRLAYYAISHNAPRILRRLLQSGVSIKRSRASHSLLIQRSARLRSCACLKVLLAAGAKVNSGRATDYSPLHVAADANSVSCVRHLLAVGAKIGIRDALGRTPADMAMAAGSSAALRILLQAGAKVTITGQTNT